MRTYIRDAGNTRKISVWARKGTYSYQLSTASYCNRESVVKC